MQHLFNVNSGYPTLTEPELLALRSHQLNIDCPQMILKSRSKAKPERYRGSGTISVQSDGNLIFKMFLNHRKTLPEFDVSLKSGEIISDDIYYDLQATDTSGRSWGATRFIANSLRTATSRFIITGFLDEIKTAARVPDEKYPGSHLSIWIFGDVKIPVNTRTVMTQSVNKRRRVKRSSNFDRWHFRSQGISFEILNEKGLHVSAHLQAGAFSRGFEHRIVEALQFVLGQPVPWSVLTKREKDHLETRISGSFPPTLKKHRFLPPLPTTMVHPTSRRITANHHTKLFDLYIKHTTKFEGSRRDIWGYLNAVYEASGASYIDAMGLTLTVVIETLLATKFPNLGKLTRAEQRQITTLKEHIDAWTGSDPLKRRLHGAVSQWSHPRAVDKMRALAKKGAIAEEQWKAWQTLRNANVHAFQATNLGTAKFSALIASGRVLLYQLIFHAIGYRGPYLDFSTPGWPVKQYPPPPTPTP